MLQRTSGLTSQRYEYENIKYVFLTTTGGRKSPEIEGRDQSYMRIIIEYLFFKQEVSPHHTTPVTDSSKSTTTTAIDDQVLWTGAGIRVTIGESGFESFLGLGDITAYRLIMSATCWQNVSADNCGRCLDDQCRPPAAFHVLFRPSNGVAGDDDDEKDGWGCPAAEPSAYDAGDLRLGVGVCDRPNAGEGCCCCCCLDDWVVERFRRNGDCCGLGVSFPPAERLRGGRVTRVTGGVPEIKCVIMT